MNIPPQSPISTSRPRDPLEPMLNATEITQSMRVTMQYEEIIRTLESAGFTITEKNPEICHLENGKKTINAYCIQNETTHLAHKVEIELCIEDESQQQSFSAEITKLFEKNNFPMKDI